MINYSIVHGGVDQDGNEIPPRFVQVAITKEMSSAFKNYFDNCIWDRDMQAWYVPLIYLDRVKELCASLSEEIEEYERIHTAKLEADMEPDLPIDAFRVAARESIEAAAKKKRERFNKN